ncbi:conserved hypothetical protein [Ricinus communis]|uniref:Uncharacterized protein n=1 Tax=Ricinus communis TaxID=3988 RepID=B9RUW4_RICCO|nr:conserved hypothetical protein [Ricinus communis]
MADPQPDPSEGCPAGTRQRIDCRAVISEQNHLSLLIQEVNVATDNEVHSSNHEDYDDDEEEEEKKKEKD